MSAAPDHASFVDEAEQPPRFVGSRCADCGALWFPPRSRCSRCAGTSLVPSVVDAVGTLYSYTVVHVGRGDIATPYALGVVDFAEGIRVFGRLVGWEDGLTIGQRVTAGSAQPGELSGRAGADFRLRLAPPTTETTR